MAETADLLASFAPMEAGPGASFAKRLRLVHPQLGASSVRTAAMPVALTWLPLFVVFWTDVLAVRRVKIPFCYTLPRRAAFCLRCRSGARRNPDRSPSARGSRSALTSGLVRESDVGKFQSIFVNSLRLRDSPIAELLIVKRYMSQGTRPSLRSPFKWGNTWFRPTPQAGLTPGATGYALVALPVYQFLILRWI
jgi:hypothetical protein